MCQRFQNISAATARRCADQAWTAGTHQCAWPEFIVESPRQSCLRLRPMANFRRLVAGGVLSLIGTAGYYGAYVFVIWRTVQGVLSIGSLTFLAGAIMQASSNIQQIFSTVSSIADQALFLSIEDDKAQCSCRIGMVAAPILSHGFGNAQLDGAAAAIIIRRLC